MEAKPGQYKVIKSDSCKYIEKIFNMYPLFQNQLLLGLLVNN